MKISIRIWPVLIIAACSSLLFPFCSKQNNSTPAPPNPPGPKTFTNPIINGSDPWIIQKDSLYYYLHTVGNRVTVWKTKAVSKLGIAASTEIFRAPAGTANAENVWAPELHFLDGKWYVYYTAGAGPDSTQRTWVLENSNAYPLSGTWVDKGRIYAADADFWAIDGTVLEYNGSRYFLWSGRPNLALQNQNIYIAKMTNPWTLESPAVMLTRPELLWELNGGPVNEAPQVLKNSNGKVFMIFSASGCWTDDYSLGVLSLRDGGNPLLPADWTKSQSPVFIKNPANNAFGPGHNAFFKSPDGTEDWMIYHANSSTGLGCGASRNIRIQSFSWNSDGTPNFAGPVKTGLSINVPSGE
jgi:GH43 family beta-xylosidase